MVRGMNVNCQELKYRLVELGADKLASMLAGQKAKDYEAAHYYKGGFQALKEAAMSLFGIDSCDFRAQCMFEITCLQLDEINRERKNGHGQKCDDRPESSEENY